MIPTAKALRDLRRRVGGAPMQRLFEVLSGPLAQPRTPGTRFGAYRTVSFDGCNSLKAPDTKGESGYARRLPHLLTPDMLVLWDKGFDGNAFLTHAAESRPGTDPDRCGFSIALHAARDLVIRPGDNPGNATDLVGVIGQRRIVAGVTGNTTAHRRRWTNRDNAASQSRVSERDTAERRARARWNTGAAENEDDQPPRAPFTHRSESHQAGRAPERLRHEIVRHGQV
jgi:hypothetical protein